MLDTSVKACRVLLSFDFTDGEVRRRWKVLRISKHKLRNTSLVRGNKVEFHTSYARTTRVTETGVDWYLDGYVCQKDAQLRLFDSVWVTTSDPVSVLPHMSISEGYPIVVPADNRQNSPVAILASLLDIPFFQVNTVDLSKKR